MNMKKRYFEVTTYVKPLIIFITKIVFFDRGLSQGVSKIGPTHHFTLLFDIGGNKETSSEIRWIKPNDRMVLKPRLSAQEADDVGFHPGNGDCYMGLSPKI